MRFQLLDELQGLKRGTSMILGPTGFLGKRGVIVLFVLLALVLVGIGGWMLLNPVAEPPAGIESPATRRLRRSRPAIRETLRRWRARRRPRALPAPPAAAAPPVARSPCPSRSRRRRARQRRSRARPSPPTRRPARLRPNPEWTRRRPTSKSRAASSTPGSSTRRSPTRAPWSRPTRRARWRSTAHYLIAKSLASLERGQEAIGAYVEIQTRFKGDPRAAEAAFQQAKLVQAADTKKTTDEAKRLYAECAATYPASPWSARALAAKAEIEREQRATVRDAALGATVPAALATYRDLTARFPAEPVAEKAWWELGQMYEDEKRWDLAAEAYEKLTQHFPQTRLDAWFQLAEIYERRLKDAARAKQAYGKVPTTSSHFKEAQKKAGS